MPCCIGVFRGIKRLSSGRFQSLRLPFSCDRWDCPICGPRKRRVLAARLKNGDLARAAKIDGFRTRYAMKFLTLTCPGKAYRNQRSPRKAYDHMVKAFDKLMRALKKRLGTFYYFRVRELHKSGYPHLHVLLVGINIAPTNILGMIKKLWRKKYGMGYVKLNARKESQTLKGAINYITKYMTKCTEFGNDFAGVRLFTASRGALERTIKQEHHWLAYKMQFGVSNENDEIAHVWEFAEDVQMEDIPAEHRYIVALAADIGRIKLTIYGGSNERQMEVVPALQ